MNDLRLIINQLFKWLATISATNYITINQATSVHCHPWLIIHQGHQAASPSRSPGDTITCHFIESWNRDSACTSQVHDALAQGGHRPHMKLTVGEGSNSHQWPLQSMVISTINHDQKWPWLWSAIIPSTIHIKPLSTTTDHGFEQYATLLSIVIPFLAPINHAP